MGPRAGLDTCGKSRPTWIRSPDRPARSQSLYRLSYPTHRKKLLLSCNGNFQTAPPLCLRELCQQGCQVLLQGKWSAQRTVCWQQAVSSTDSQLCADNRLSAVPTVSCVLATGCQQYRQSVVCWKQAVSSTDSQLCAGNRLSAIPTVSETKQHGTVSNSILTAQRNATHSECYSLCNVC